MPTVLIVDDSKLQRNIIQHLIEPMGCTAILCESGQQALFSVSETVPDLIIMDVEMPGLSGFETCKAIRGLLQDHWIPIIYLSAHNEPRFMAEGLNAGGDAYVTKPVDEDVLTAIVKAMLRITDIQNELMCTNKKLDELAYYDVLTQVMNRRGYQDMLDRLWKDHHRRRAPLTVLLMDIDFFKKYNDNYGHIAGDQCLREVAQTLKNALERPIDILARYGGEEFVMVLPNTDRKGGLVVGQKIVETLRQAAIPHEYSDAAPHVTLSIGVADSVDLESTELMIKKADDALYQAKDLGRNQSFCANL